MPPWFDKVLGPGNRVHLPDEGAELWDFSKYEPEVFVLALGTNDFSEMYPHVDETAYVSKYRGFLEELRERYPNAEVFCLAPFKAGAPWDEARAYIALAVAATEDENIHSIDPLGDAPEGAWLSYPSDFVTGDEYHPNLAGHRKIAERLGTIVEAEMGW
jgi:lysophospholipase L1-like esterase